MHVRCKCVLICIKKLPIAITKTIVAILVRMILVLTVVTVISVIINNTQLTKMMRNCYNGNKTTTIVMMRKLKVKTQIYLLIMVIIIFKINHVHGSCNKYNHLIVSNMIVNNNNKNKNKNNVQM